MHKRKISAKQALLRVATPYDIGTAPIAKMQTNFSRFTICDIPDFTTNYLYFACLLCVLYISEPQRSHCS